MSEAKTDYNPQNYNANSLANVMQFIAADEMIRRDIDGSEAFVKFQPKIVQLRGKIVGAHSAYTGKRAYMHITLANVAEGVLLHLRDGAELERVLDYSHKKLFMLCVKDE